MKQWYVNLGIHTNDSIVDVWVTVWAPDEKAARTAAYYLWPGHRVYAALDTPPDA